MQGLGTEKGALVLSVARGKYAAFCQLNRPEREGSRLVELEDKWSPKRVITPPFFLT